MMYDRSAVLFICSVGTHAGINNGYRLFTLYIQILQTPVISHRDGVLLFMNYSFNSRRTLASEWIQIHHEMHHVCVLNGQVCFVSQMTV